MREREGVAGEKNKSEVREERQSGEKQRQSGSGERERERERRERGSR